MIAHLTNLTCILQHSLMAGRRVLLLEALSQCYSLSPQQGYDRLVAWDDYPYSSNEIEDSDQPLYM